jgi:hypothetical protein
MEARRTKSYNGKGVVRNVLHGGSAFDNVAQFWRGDAIGSNNDGTNIQ